MFLPCAVTCEHCAMCEMLKLTPATLTHIDHISRISRLLHCEVELSGGRLEVVVDHILDNYCPDMRRLSSVSHLILTFLYFYTSELMSPTEDDLADIVLFKTI